MGTHIVDAERYPIKEGAIFTLAPGQVHAWDISPDSQGHVINVSVDFLHDALRAGSHKPGFSIFDDPETCPVLYLNAGQSAVLLDIVNRLESEHHAGGAIQANIVQAYFYIFLMKLYQYCLTFHSHRDCTARSADIVKRFRLLVDQNLASGMSIKDYASLLHVTDTHLTKATKKITGATARQLINERILLEAKRLLIHGGISVAEVAYQLGFKDPSYFSRFFKKSTNLSPKEFRAGFGNVQRVRSERC
ncbi:MAG: AraC family transcriptional regulator [Pseudomonadota bacterium]|nr:AraC family transcriptional regulator [Pseudomonadota bacterium]